MLRNPYGGRVNLWRCGDASIGMNLYLTSDRGISGAWPRLPIAVALQSYAAPSLPGRSIAMVLYGQLMLLLRLDSASIWLLLGGASAVRLLLGGSYAIWLQDCSADNLYRRKMRPSLITIGYTRCSKVQVSVFSFSLAGLTSPARRISSVGFR